MDRCDGHPLARGGELGREDRVEGRDAAPRRTEQHPQSARIVEMKTAGQPSRMPAVELDAQRALLAGGRNLARFTGQAFQNGPPTGRGRAAVEQARRRNPGRRTQALQPQDRVQRLVRAVLDLHHRARAEDDESVAGPRPAVEEPARRRGTHGLGDVEDRRGGDRRPVGDVQRTAPPDHPAQRNPPAFRRLAVQPAD
ncbi:hypothetical protein, partial [Actinocorallia lasiicapitis]